MNSTVAESSAVVEELKSLRESAESRAELAVQYCSGSRYPAALEPEIRLMLMILEDAVLCYQRYFGATDGIGRKEFADAERWLFGKSSDWVFSFENICACVGVGAEYLRDGLRAWKKNAEFRRSGKNSGAAAAARISSPRPA